MPSLQQIKMLYKSQSVRSMGMYTFSNFFSKAVSFLLLFVFTNPAYISPSENGMLSLFSNSMLFLMPFLAMGIVHSVSAEYFKLDDREFRSLFSTSLIMPLVVMAGSIIFLFLVRGKLNESYGFPSSFVWLIPVVTFLIFINEQLLSMARNNLQPQLYLKANMGKTILELGLSFILVVYFAWRWQGRVAGILAAYGILGVYALYYFKQKGYLFGKIQKKYIRSELIYAIPIMALQASIFTMNSSDKFFLSHATNDNNATVGVYSIACIFASIINVLSMALLQHIFPSIYRVLSGEHINYKFIRRQFVVYISVLTIGLISLIAVMPVVYDYFINEKYHEALEYSYLLCIGVYLWALNYFFYSFLLYYKEKRKLLFLSLACIAISLACNYYFINRWQAMGAAASSVSIYALVLVIALAFTRKYWKPLWNKS